MTALLRNLFLMSGSLYYNMSLCVPRILMFKLSISSLTSCIGKCWNWWTLTGLARVMKTVVAYFISCLDLLVTYQVGWCFDIGTAVRCAGQAESCQLPSCVRINTTVHGWIWSWCSQTTVTLCHYNCFVWLEDYQYCIFCICLFCRTNKTILCGSQG